MVPRASCSQNLWKAGSNCNFVTFVTNVVQFQTHFISQYVLYEFETLKQTLKQGVWLGLVVTSHRLYISDQQKWKLENNLFLLLMCLMTSPKWVLFSTDEYRLIYNKDINSLSLFCFAACFWFSHIKGSLSLQVPSVSFRWQCSSDKSGSYRGKGL